MGLAALTAGVFALGAYLGRDISGAWAIVFYLVAFAVLRSMNAAVRRSESGCRGCHSVRIGPVELFGGAVICDRSPRVAPAGLHRRSMRRRWPRWVCAFGGRTGLVVS